MATLKNDLPPHCQIKKRKGYCDAYFMPHPKDRPEGWRPTFHLGRTDKQSPAEITAKANELYKEYLDFTHKVVTGVDLSKKSGTLPDIIGKYQSSEFWKDLSRKTRMSYEVYLRDIHAWSERTGHPHISLMTAKSIVKWLSLYADTPVAQTKAKGMLSILYKVAVIEAYVDRNIVPEIMVHRRKTEKRKLVIWEDCDVKAFIASAAQFGLPSVGRALVMGLETAQRRGDVLRMQKPRDYDPATGRLKFKQSKTGKMVSIKATSLLREFLDQIPSDQLPLFINERTGKPWEESGFTHIVREIADAAGLKNHIFAHTRHSSILYLHRAGVDTKGIASITGHSLKTVDTMLQEHYLETRDQVVADAAIEQLENYRVRQIGQTSGQTND